MEIDNAAEQFRLLARAWAEADGEALRAEKLEKVVFSELVNQSNDGSVAKAEHSARAHSRYKDAVDRLVNSRTAANIARAEMDAMKLRVEIWRSRNATKRAEMQL